jgi:hypothetical protein
MTPEGIDTTAPVIARHSTTIDAPLSVVWRLHTDVTGWPGWQKAIDEAHLDGPFVAGAVFSWRTYNLAITSTVYHVEPERHTLWGGPSQGITGIHSWTFTPMSGGVLVETEESWSGPPVEADVAGLQGALDAALVAWLEYLDTAARRAR